MRGKFIKDFPGIYVAILFLNLFTQLIYMPNNSAMRSLASIPLTPPMAEEDVYVFTWE